jgi:threonine dehydrogenase-like Zn-dependent dehydrogenase
MHARALVQTGARKLEIRELEVPADIRPDQALLRIESNAVCGSDYEQYRGADLNGMAMPFPLIPGHEPVGRIEKIGDDARRLWGVDEGDRVFVEALKSCGRCRSCRATRGSVCSFPFVYGYQSLDLEHGLWGGMAEYMAITDDTVLHHIPDAVSVEDAAFINAMGAGFQWAVTTGGVGVGDRVLVIGPGQRGIACLVAALEAGARQVILAGLTKDQHKLDLAKRFGAHAVIDVQATSLVEAVRELTDHEGPDVVLDLAPGAPQTVVEALEVVARGGAVVLAATKGMHPADGFFPDRLQMKNARLLSARPPEWWATEQAIRVIAKQRYPFAAVHSHTMPLEQAERAIRIFGGEMAGEDALHVTIAPGLT